MLDIPNFDLSLAYVDLQNMAYEFLMFFTTLT